MSPDHTDQQPSTKALKLFLKYMWSYKRYTIFGVLFSLMLALQATVIPLLIALTLGQLIHEHTVNILLMVSAGAALTALLLLSYAFDTFGVAPLHDKVVKKLYKDCFKYLAHQDYSFFADRFSGSIVTQASRFAKSYTTFNDTIFFGVLPHLFSALIILGIVFWYSPFLGLAVLILWLLAMGLIVKFALQRLPLRRAAVAKESEQIGELADVINNALTVKTFATESRELERYDAINIKRGRLYLFSWHRAVRNAWIVEAVCGVLQMTVFIGGILAVKDSSIGVATFLLFQVYIFKMIDNISRSVFIVRQLEAVSRDAQEMTELLEQKPFIQDKADASKSNIAKGALSLKDMSFQYDGTGQHQALFKNFNLAIKPGEKIGLVGPSGGGKTTITRLLLRFMDVSGGSIQIDGQDIRDITQHDLRSAISYVPQEPLLFHRSIKDNIRYGNPSASDEQIIQAAKQAYAHDFIASLPEGYDTLVGERGVKLSGGQRQRVAIARAMLKNAPVLVLDEATSALDSESEKLIQKALWELMKNKTAVVIAHRLSTIQKMDRIIVLDEGRIVEEGPHQKLVANKALYAKLWSHQSGGFIEDN